MLPDYELAHDPYLLPDIDKAIKRLAAAKKNNEKIVIYGDYDIDGLSATTLLADAMHSFGFDNFETYIPSRFEEGYGLNEKAIEKFAKQKTDLIITVDCGSNSVKEIDMANKLGIDVIVTDHHEVVSTGAPALALVNPKSQKSKYPFKDLAGVGVAFKLVQAIQSKMDGLSAGQEKWLLDLVAIGTVCDVVDLIDENRIFAYWGLRVLSKTKRPGLKALMAVSGIEPEDLDTYSIGFGLGPRMNAAGRLETAKHALELLSAQDSLRALETAEYLDDLNKARRLEQNKIFEQAIAQAEKHETDPVLVVSDPGWNHGIVGIVASKMMEKYKKPCFVMQEMGKETKGSARSFGDFSIVDGVEACRDLISKGGGHKFAAGVTLPTKNVPAFRKRINDYYVGLKLKNQADKLLPKVDAVAKLDELDEDIVKMISQLKPFGMGNPRPVIKCDSLMVAGVRRMGDSGQHIKLDLKEKNGKSMQFLSFNAPESYYVELGDIVSVCFSLSVNEWRGNRAVEGQILHLEAL